MKSPVSSEHIVLSRDAHTKASTTWEAARDVGTISSNQSKYIAAKLLSPTLLLSLWEISSRVGLLDARFFPPPTTILPAFFHALASPEIWNAVGVTLLRILIGFLLGAIPAIVIGLLAGMNRLVREGLAPIIGALYPIPKIVILPLIILIVGLNDKALYTVVAIGVFFPILLNTMHGTTSIPSILWDVAKNLKANAYSRFISIALPGSLPSIITGIRVAWGMGLLIIIASEFIVADRGLGFLIYQAWQTFAIEKLYVGLIFVSLVGIVSFVLLDRLERLIVNRK